MALWLRTSLSGRAPLSGSTTKLSRVLIVVQFPSVRSTHRNLYSLSPCYVYSVLRTPYIAAHSVLRAIYKRLRGLKSRAGSGAPYPTSRDRNEPLAEGLALPRANVVLPQTLQRDHVMYNQCSEYFSKECVENIYGLCTEYGRTHMYMDMWKWCGTSRQHVAMQCSAAGTGIGPSGASLARLPEAKGYYFWPLSACFLNPALELWYESAYGVLRTHDLCCRREQACCGPYLLVSCWHTPHHLCSDDVVYFSPSHPSLTPLQRRVVALDPGQMPAAPCNAGSLLVGNKGTRCSVQVWMDGRSPYIRSTYL